MIPSPLKALLWFQAFVCLVGVWISVDFERLHWISREPRTTLVDELEPLRPLVKGSPRIDYLMDRTPLEAIADPKKRRAVKRRQKDGVRRFRVQYAFAPGHVHPARSLQQIRRQALAETPPYYVLWDGNFHSSLQDVLKTLRPVAKSRGLELEHHRIERRYALVVLDRPDGNGG